VHLVVLHRLAPLGQAFLDDARAEAGDVATFIALA
jgi:hypothetical protein